MPMENGVWDFRRVILGPDKAVAAIMAGNRRIAELLEANNRYQQEAREARAATAAAESKVALWGAAFLEKADELAEAKARIAGIEARARRAEDDAAESQRLHSRILEDRAKEIVAREAAEKERDEAAAKLIAAEALAEGYRKTNHLTLEGHRRALQIWLEEHPEDRLMPPDLAQLDAWLLEQLSEARDKADGLASDLESALDVLIRRINGQGDLESAAEWVRLNYPDRAAAIGRKSLVAEGDALSISSGSDGGGDG